MAKCHYCERYIPDDAARCPHCYTRSESAAEQSTQTRKKSQRRTIPATIAGMPAPRAAVFGCLGLILLTVVCGTIFVVVSPDTTRSLVYGKSTAIPPTPRPTRTPTPAPTATPRWAAYEGPEESYLVKFSPYWVVINFADPEWRYTFARESRRRPWLEERLPQDIRETENVITSTWAFDPLSPLVFSIRVWTDPAMAGMSAKELRDTLGEGLLESVPTWGGQVRGGIRADLTELDGRPAASFEVVVQPGADSEVNEPIQLLFYVVADEKRGYWIEISGTQRELSTGMAHIQTVLDSFNILEKRRQ